MIEDLFGVHVASIKLKILVFGPDPNSTSADPHVVALRDKRVQIRNHLLADGHDVRFPEDLVNPNLPAPANNPILQEILLSKAYDVIVHLVQSPGTQIELGVFCTREDVCRKLQLFICKDYTGGLSYKACQMGQEFGAALSEYTYPTDLVDCHLLTAIAESVTKIQMAKYLNPN